MAERLEHRIIAETLRAARRPDDMALDFAAEQLGMTIRPGKAENADEAPGAALEGCRAGLLHGGLDLLHRHGKIARAIGSFRPVGGIDAGSAVQRIDHQAGIIRQGRQARGPGRSERLDRGIFLKRRAGFIRLAKFRSAADLAAKPSGPIRSRISRILPALWLATIDGLGLRACACRVLSRPWGSVCQSMAQRPGSAHSRLLPAGSRK